MPPSKGNLQAAGPAGSLGRPSIALILIVTVLMSTCAFLYYSIIPYTIPSQPESPALDDGGDHASAAAAAIALPVTAHEKLQDSALRGPTTEAAASDNDVLPIKAADKTPQSTTQDPPLRGKTEAEASLAHDTTPDNEEPPITAIDKPPQDPSLRGTTAEAEASSADNTSDNDAADKTQEEQGETSLIVAQAPAENESANDLEKVLRAAAMPTEEKTVILTTLNAAWSAPGSVLDLFLESFRIGEGTEGLLRHLVIICIDQKAYEKCSKVHRHCYALRTEGVDFSGEELRYMSEGYLKMLWRKMEYLQDVLQAGYSFIFTDVDIMWFRDPRPMFWPAEADFQVSSDKYNGNPRDTRNWPNTGIMFMRQSNKTVEFLKYWYEARSKHPGKHEQHVLNYVKGDRYVVSTLGVTIRFLDPLYFGGLCQISGDLDKVVTMHANCCVGLKNKLVDLALMLDDWKRYSALPLEQKDKNTTFWSVPMKCKRW